MMSMSSALLNLIIILGYFALCALTSVEFIKNKFGSKICIEGSLLTIAVKEAQAVTLIESNSDNTNIPIGNISFSPTNTKNDKSLLSKLHELAQFNELEYFFKLQKEEGPPHNKIFTVTLTLGDEEFIGEGTSLKKAQYNAAEVALQNTEYEPPLAKEIDKNEDSLTPTVLLNNLSAKLGIGVEYFVLKNDIITSNNNAFDAKSRKTYFQKLNDSINSTEFHVRKEESQLKGPFNVKVQVGDLYFYGSSHTIQAARHAAASKAVDHLIQQVQRRDSACLKEDSLEQCKQAKNNLKSPISLVYEAAQIRQMDVEFEVIKESGPSHKKVFTTQCRLGHISTEADGKSKKESKKTAASSMLDRLSELPKVTQEMQVKNILKDKSKKKKRKKILKTKFDVINMQVDNLISSVLGGGTPPENHPKRSIHSNGKQKFYKKSYQDDILELSNLLSLDVQFSDFNDQDQFYSLMSINLNPEHICLGQGPSTKTARNKAAKGGLKLLQSIDFEVHFKDHKYVLLESDLKGKIHSLLNQELYEEESKPSII